MDLALEEPSPARLQFPRPMRPSGLVFAWNPWAAFFAASPNGRGDTNFSLWRRKNVETFQHHLRMCYSVRGNHRVPPDRRSFRRLTLPPSRATDARSTPGSSASQSARWLSARTRSSFRSSRRGRVKRPATEVRLHSGATTVHGQSKGCHRLQVIALYMQHIAATSNSHLQ